MAVETIKLLKTLKAGNKVWVKGTIVSDPIPKILLQELALDRGTIEVIKKSVEGAPIPTVVDAPSSKPKLLKKGAIKP